MTLIPENAVTVLGNAEIDNDHRVFIALLNELAAAGNAQFPDLFRRLHELTEQHFEHETQLMRQSAFPAESEHAGEHRRVLGEFKQFQTRVDKGLTNFGRAFVKERLPQWFQLHVDTMDNALAAHLNVTPNSRG